jgi:hypothetical protein
MPDRTRVHSIGTRELLARATLTPNAQGSITEG